MTHKQAGKLLVGSGYKRKIHFMRGVSYEKGERKFATFAGGLSLNGEKLNERQFIRKVLKNISQSIKLPLPKQLFCCVWTVGM